MSYYLKKTRLKGRTYLSIDESFYSSKTKGTAHRVFKSLGSVETLKEQGMEDPISFYQQEVDRLNEQAISKAAQKIGESPIRFLGYFPLKSILEKMKIPQFVRYFNLTNDFQFDLYDVLSSLVFARAVCPCSKRRTFHDVIPCLCQPSDFSYNQLMNGLSFLGNNYEKFVELFTNRTMQLYPLNTKNLFFDCTNFYFEIDREDDWRRKGPSKEQRRDPIIGMGLLLDGNQIPIGMKMYPGNQSEKPVIRETITYLKERSNVTGRTIHVADKGLNCAENIFHAIAAGDGYLFSKSVKTLPQIEKEWVLLENSDWHDVTDKNGTLLYRYKSCVSVFPYSFVQEDGTVKEFSLEEKRVLTWNPSLAKKQRMEMDKLVEKAKAYSVGRAKKSEYGEASKYVTFLPLRKSGEINDDDQVIATLNEEKVNQDRALLGYNLLVTSERKMPDGKIYEIYHNLWRIEESFRIMKSDLDARPVYCQKIETILGHFLICYITVLLERLFQFNELGNEYSSNEIFEFMRDYRVIEIAGGYFNTTSKSDFITKLSEKTRLPLDHLNLTEKQVQKILSFRF